VVAVSGLVERPAEVVAVSSNVPRKWLSEPFSPNQIRTTIAWVAGLAGMAWPRFLFWNAFGGIAWATTVGLVAYLGGRALAETVSRYGLYAGAAIAATAALSVAAPRLIRRLR
jgi:membrane protein DedA with SNARE-associated domain